MKPAPLVFAAGLALVAPAACANMNPASSTPALDQSFDLRVDRSATVHGTDLVVRFRGVPADSRCPVDVQCVVAGDATALMVATGGGAPSATYELHTHQGARETTRGVYRVALLGMKPLPVSTRQISSDEYVVTLRVSRRD